MAKTQKQNQPKRQKKVTLRPAPIVIQPREPKVVTKVVREPKSPDHVKNKALAYLLALAWCHPEAFASHKGHLKLLQLVNPAFRGYDAKKYRYGELNCAFHIPVSGRPGYGRMGRAAGIGKDEFCATASDPTVAELNNANNLAFVGHYAAMGVSSQFPVMAIQEASVGTVYPIIAKEVAGDKDMLPTVDATNPTTPFTPLSTTTRTAGSAVSFNYAVELNRPSLSAWQMQLRGKTSAGAVAWHVTIDIAANVQAAQGTANTTALIDLATTDRVDLTVTVAPSSDVLPLKFTAIKTTATNSGTPVFNVTGAIPAAFEDDNYLISWMKFYNSAAYDGIIANGWKNMMFLTLGGEGRGKNLATPYYKGGKQHHGLVANPLEFGAPFKSLQNVTVGPDNELSRGFSHLFVPAWEQLVYGSASSFSGSQQNALIIYQAPEGASNYQSIVLTNPTIYSILTLNGDLGAQTNEPDRAIYDKAVSLCGGCGLRVTYNDNHVQFLQGLIRKGRKFLKKHQRTIHNTVSDVGNALSKVLDVAEGGLALAGTLSVLVP